MTEPTQRRYECPHIVTSRRDGSFAYWCVKCGEKVRDEEERPCKDCANFSASGWVLGICKYHGGYVTKDLHVTYKISEGTCWKANTERAPVGE